MVETESIDTVIEFPVAIRVREMGEEFFVICEYAGVKQIDRRDFPGGAVIAFQIGDAPDDRAWFPVQRIIKEKIVAVWGSEAPTADFHQA